MRLDVVIVILTTRALSSPPPVVANKLSFAVEGLGVTVGRRSLELQAMSGASSSDDDETEDANNLLSE